MNTNPINRSDKSKIIFTMGGKGGTGKTTAATAVVEYFHSIEYEPGLLDLDAENKQQGSLVHFFPKALKIDIANRTSLDIFIDQAETEPILIADLGGGSGKVSAEWFQSMYPLVADTMSFLAIGLITSDPASVKSVLTWVTALGHKAEYLIVLNAGDQEEPDFKYWRKDTVQEIMNKYTFKEITMRSRHAKIQNALRNHGATLTSVAEKTVNLPELQEVSSIVRAQAYRRELFAEFARVKDFLLP